MNPDEIRRKLRISLNTNNFVYYSRLAGTTWESKQFGVIA